MMDPRRDFKAPPSMSNDLPYSEWKHEAQIWQAFTSLAKKKHGPALFLSLSGSARDAAHEVPLADINKVDSLDTLLKKVDDFFLKDNDNATFEAYNKFERYQTPTSMSIVDYINTVGRMYQKAKNCKFGLPAGVLAYRLLQSANISDSHKQGWHYATFF